MNLRRQGEAWEREAEKYLAAQGAKILQRNYRRPVGEIDLICTMGGVVVFVEVKQRSSVLKGSPGAAVNRIKQARISRTALWYLKENGLLDAKARFDVIEILDGELRHIQGAFLFAKAGNR